MPNNGIRERYVVAGHLVDGVTGSDSMRATSSLELRIGHFACHVALMRDVQEQAKRCVAGAQIRSNFMAGLHKKFAMGPVVFRVRIFRTLIRTSISSPCTSMSISNRQLRWRHEHGLIGRMSAINCWFPF